MQSAGRVLGKPCPAGSEDFHGSFLEFFLEDLHRTEVPDQVVLEFQRHRLRVRGEGVEEEGVVPYLGRVVEDRTRGGENQCLERYFRIRGALCETVEIVDIGLEMLAVMVLDGLTAHSWLQCIGCIWERG